MTPAEYSFFSLMSIHIKIQNCAIYKDAPYWVVSTHPCVVLCKICVHRWDRVLQFKYVDYIYNMHRVLPPTHTLWSAYQVHAYGTMRVRCMLCNLHARIVLCKLQIDIHPNCVIQCSLYIHSDVVACGIPSWDNDHIRRCCCWFRPF